MQKQKQEGRGQQVQGGDKGERRTKTRGRTGAAMNGGWPKPPNGEETAGGSHRAPGRVPGISHTPPGLP